MAKNPKKSTGRKVTPEKNEEAAMADAVMAMMGESMPARPQSGTALQRAKASTQNSAGDAYGGDGSMEAQKNTAIDLLGDAAYEMDAAQLLEAIGLQPDPKAAKALDQLSPDERLDLLRALGPMEDTAAVAEQAASVPPSEKEELLRSMGVE